MRLGDLRLLPLLILVTFSGAAAPSSELPTVRRKTHNMIVVTTDGLRWQEVFTGANPSLLRRAEQLESDGASRKRAHAAQQEYGNGDFAERRFTLMPFLWNTVAARGQIFGNHAEGSDVVVTNGLNVSYPGYNELLTGIADPRITTNDKIPNPNVTVLEWLQQKPEFEGKVAAFGAWDAFSTIFNSKRCGFPVNSGYDLFTHLPSSPTVASLNKVKTAAPRIWDDEPFDVIPFYTALEYIKSDKPRVAFIGLGETDDWAHARNYPEYLKAAHRADQFVASLWELLQSMPEYRDSTTLIFTTDHGRGEGASWSDHGAEIPDSRYLWFAVLGPEVPALGERKLTAEIQQTQFASTIASLLGDDFLADFPNAGRPIEGLNRRAMLLNTSSISGNGLRGDIAALQRTPYGVNQH